jgi:parvulin-like peptidyl-prolyl isomerase
MTNLISVLLVGLLCASTSAHADAPKRPLAPAAATAKPGAPPTQISSAEVARRAQAVITYAGGQVTVGELEDAIAQQSPFMRGRYKDPANLKELLEKTLRFSLMSDEAARRGFDKADAVTQSVKQNAVQQLMKADFDDQLSAASIPAEEIAKYYEAHIDEYVEPAMQRASHVMVATEAEAKALLVEAKSMDLRAFRQAARDKSIDEASKLRGGDLRYFDDKGKARGETEVSVPAPIAKAAFALKEIGDTAAAPIKIPGGFSIVKLTGQRQALSRKLDEVEATIRVRLWRERRQSAIESFVAKLRGETQPAVHPELADAIKLAESPSVQGPGIPAGFPTAAIPPAQKPPAAPHTP